MSGRPGSGLKERFSHDRFHQLPPDNSSGTTMANPRDATINIPLQPVSSNNTQTGARNGSVTSHHVASMQGQPSQEEETQDEKHSGNPFHGHRKNTGGLEEDKGANAPEDGKFNKLGRMYLAILNFSVITRYFIYVLPLAALIAIPIVIGATVAKNAKIGGVRIVWFFTWVEVVWLSLWVSKTVAHYLPFVFQFLCGIVSSGTRKYALMLKALEIPISLVGWSVTSLATFIPLMTRNPTQRGSGDTSIRPWQDVVKNILFAAFVCSLILAGEKILVQLISIGHHRKQFDWKIQESKKNVNMLSLLYEASRKMFPEYCPEFEAEDNMINDSLIAKKGGQTNNGAASPMRLLQNVGKVGDKITAAVGNVAQEITGKQVFNSGSARSVVTLALEKRRSSEALARRLWMSFVLEGRDALYLEDFTEVFGPGRDTQAEECFGVLDRDTNGDISLEEMILTVVEFGRARKDISKSMHDVDQAIHALDDVLCFVVFIAAVLVFVAFLNKGFGTTLAAGATAMLSLSFVFATTAREVLGSCIFLFVKHPYDVGDRIDFKTQKLIVERISLLFTIFRNAQDQRCTQIPNAVLNTTWLDNLTRSKGMSERITLTLDFGTAFGDIQLLKMELQKFTKENYRDFHPEVDTEIVGLGEMSKLEVLVEVRHKSNWSNESVISTRRSKLMCALVIAARKVPIYGPGGGFAAVGSSDNPSYSVTVSDEDAKTKRDDFASGKESGRMIPTSEMDGVLSMSGAGDSQSKTSGFGAQDTSGLQHRTTSASRPSDEPQTTEASFIDNLHTRPAAMNRMTTDDSFMFRSPSQNAPAPQPTQSDGTGLQHAPSMGHRRADHSYNPPRNYVSPNTPVDTPAENPMDQHQQYAVPGASGAGPATQSPYQSSTPYPQRSQQPPPPGPPGRQQSQDSVPRRPLPQQQQQQQYAPQPPR